MGSATLTNRGQAVPTWLRAHFPRLVRYASVSVVSTAVSITVLGTLVTTHTLTPGWANIAATIAATVPSFELNRRWVWAKTGTRSVTREVVPYTALSLLGLALSTIAVTIVGHLVDGVHPAVRTGALEVASLASWGSLWLVQYAILHRVLFAAEREPIPALNGLGG